MLLHNIGILRIFLIQRQGVRKHFYLSRRTHRILTYIRAQRAQGLIVVVMRGRHVLLVVDRRVVCGRVDALVLVGGLMVIGGVVYIVGGGGVVVIEVLVFVRVEGA